jgi:hypothetical protein
VRIYGTAHYASSVRKEQQMRKIKELTVCIAQLEAVLTGNDVRPEQRKDVQRAIERMKQLRRIPHPTQREVLRAVREITEALLSAFQK